MALSTKYNEIFFPLEANPESFNPLALALGLDTSKLSFIDIYTLDELQDIPQPVSALILLAPNTIGRWDDENRVPAEGESLDRGDREGLVWIRQKEANQCGTIALLHALANSSAVKLRDGPIKSVFDQCRSQHLGPEESANLLAKTHINHLHNAASTTGQSPVPDRVLLDTNHFAAFVEHRGQVFELDGACRPTPVFHGVIPTDSNFLHSVVKVVKNLIKEESGKINFSLMALAPTQKQ